MKKDNTKENLIISQAGNDKPRIMLNTLRTKEYVTKLSYATSVKITFEDGTWIEYECGEKVNQSK